uniref:Ig-like domain-containing protein n=1 Tax=Setaria digitata TaxID=48799 RepID=A0A915PCR8_9BILA
MIELKGEKNIERAVFGKSGGISLGKKDCNNSTAAGQVRTRTRTPVNCSRTPCSYLAEAGVIDCSQQHFDKIAHTARLNAPKSVFYPSAVGDRIRLLNLSGNAFRSINSSSFSSLRHPEALEVLDISHNTLVFISPGAFKALSNLKILLLNDNQLHALDRLSFADLESLEELNLDSNLLSSFPDRTFAPLIKLRRISIMSNQLSCDCQIADLLRFVKDERVQVSNRTVCMFPYSLRGMQIASLNVKTLKRSCGKGDFNPAIFDLEPASHVIVYPGDQKNITCRISKSNEIYMEWLKNNVPFPDSSRLITRRYNDGQFLYVELCLNPVIWEDEGDWTCYVEQDGSVLRNTIRVTPVLVNTVQCVEEWQADEKGEIIWAVSKQGLATAKCPNGPANARAYRQCKHGKWEAPNTSQCSYTSPVIEHFLTLLHHRRTSVYVDELLRIKRRPAEMSAYETRLAGWLVGNATGLSSRQTLAALNFILQSGFARTELNGELMRQYLQRLLLGDQIIQEDNLAICQHLFAKGYHGTEAETMKGGFLALHDGTKFSCREQQFVELLPKTGGASLRIPRLTIDQFSSLTIVRVLWLSNSNIFKSKHTSDGKWIVMGEVYGVAIKHIPLRSSKSDSIPEEMVAAEKSDDFYGFLVSYQVKKTIDQIQLGVWNDEEGWKLIKETNCLLRRVGPNNVLFACSRIFFTSNVDENIKYFAAMQNTSYQELLLQGKLSKVVRNVGQRKFGREVHTEAEKIALYGAIMEMYFIAYGIPLIAISTVLATDSLSYDASPKLCFPLQMVRIRMITYAVYAPIFICIIFILGIIVIILRLLIKINRLSVGHICKHLNQSDFTYTPDFFKDLSLWVLLLILALYSIDCYAAAAHVNQLNDLSLPVRTFNSYCNAIFNVLLAFAIFYAFTLESIRTILREVRDSDRSACVAKPLVKVPYICRESSTAASLRQGCKLPPCKESSAGYFHEEWVRISKIELIVQSLLNTVVQKECAIAELRRRLQKLRSFLFICDHWTSESLAIVRSTAMVTNDKNAGRYKFARNGNNKVDMRQALRTDVTALATSKRSVKDHALWLT